MSQKFESRQGCQVYDDILQESQCSYRHYVGETV